MPTTEKCTHCTFHIPDSWSYCPHCARPGLYQNVRKAAKREERNALQKRYSKATHDAKARKADTVLDRFEREVDERSQAVINRRFSEIDRLSTSDRELYSTYYKLLDSDLKLPAGDKWDSLRPVAERAMFPGYEREIRFAALTLDGAGLTSYGSCSIVLRTDMIAHRASVFEENCVLFMEHHDIRIADAHLRDRQDAVREVREAWLRLPARLFEKESDRRRARAVLVREGFFHQLVRVCIGDESVGNIQFGEVLMACSGRAQVLKLMNRLDEAIEAFDQSIHIDPDNVVAKNGRAETLRATGRLEEALRAYEAAAAAHPEDVVAKCGRAETLRAMGHLKAALQGYDGAIAVNQAADITPPPLTTDLVPALRDAWDELQRRFKDNLPPRISDEKLFRLEIESLSLIAA